MVQIGYRCEICLTWHSSRTAADECQQKCYDNPKRIIKEILSCGCVKAHEWEGGIGTSRLKTNQFHCKPCKSHTDFWKDEWTYFVPSADRETGIKVGSNIRMILSKNILTNGEEVIGVFGSYMEKNRLGNYIGSIERKDVENLIKFLNQWHTNQEIIV